jgi:hypothetical protein
MLHFILYKHERSNVAESAGSCDFAQDDGLGPPHMSTVPLGRGSGSRFACPERRRKKACPERQRRKACPERRSL